MSCRIVEDYYRQQHFDFFRSYEMPFYSIVFNLEITAVKAFSTDRGYPAYLTQCFLFARGMSRVEDSGRLMVPVGLGVNHIFIDGAAIGKLVEEVQTEYDNPG